MDKTAALAQPTEVESVAKGSMTMEKTPFQEQNENIKAAIQLLPPEIQDQVRDFIQSLLREDLDAPETELQLDWKGALRDLRERYTAVDLQHRALEWWGS
jgi:hypothetical protein